MKVFISCSGDRSLAIAKALRQWLPKVIQSLKPWLSEIDIGKGARWEQEIGIQLAQTKFGIICLTPENLDSRWINFEAGALSKAIEKTALYTYLFDLKPTDIAGPLSQFKHTKAEKEDTRKLIYTINDALEDQAVDKEVVDFAFDNSWDLLEESLSKLPPPTKQHAPTMGIEDKIDEILELTRLQAREGRSFVWHSKLPQPRLPSTLDWEPEDAQLLLELYQLKLREYVLVRDESIREKLQNEINGLRTDEEFARQSLISLRTFGYLEANQEKVIEALREKKDEHTDS